MLESRRANQLLYSHVALLVILYIKIMAILFSTTCIYGSTKFNTNKCKEFGLSPKKRVWTLDRVVKATQVI